jgi:hypothetical protein
MKITTRICAPWPVAAGIEIVMADGAATLVAKAFDEPIVRVATSICSARMIASRISCLNVLNRPCATLLFEECSSVHGQW